MKNLIILNLLLFLTINCSESEKITKPDSEPIEPIWESFVVPTGNIRTIEMDNNDNLIVGTEDQGVHIKMGNQWQSFTEDDGLFSNGIQCIAVNKNNLIYVGHDYSRFEVGISVFDGENWEILSLSDTIPTYPYDDVHSITFDENNVLWVAFHGGQIHFYYHNSWYDVANETKTFGTGTQGKIAFDNNGVLWGNGEDTSFKFDGTVWQELLYDGHRLDSYTLTVDQDDLVWFGSWRNGIYVYNGPEIQLFTVENSGLPSNRIHYLITDKKNDKWITSDSGLTKYDGSTWQTISISDTTLTHIGRYLTVDSKNNIWIAGLSDKVTVYRREQF